MYYTYILANKLGGTFYVGITNNLQKRIFEHKEELVEGFTKKYGIKTLVYYEIHEDVKESISREKLIKKWRRSMKIETIREMNSEWKDLYFEL
jgi:putative endonuclease